MHRKVSRVYVPEVSKVQYESEKFIKCLLWAQYMMMVSIFDLFAIAITGY